MKLKLYQVDSFTDKLFGGNPAAVCPLDNWLPDAVLLTIAKENFLPETAFFVPVNDDQYALRWFTPEIEMDLCGHATLAAAHVLYNHLGYTKNKLHFTSASGPLTVEKNGDLLTLDFPARMPEPAEAPEIILAGIGVTPAEVWKDRDYVLVYENEEIIRNMKPDQSLLNQINLDPGGIIVTAPGNKVDFVSRFFTPQASIFEDPVTGSAHCSLIPYWSRRLNKKHLTAQQVSTRLGTLTCTDLGERVLIAGNCVTYLEGVINVREV